jgi:uncharacterized protein (DUF983 family)
MDLQAEMLLNKRELIRAHRNGDWVNARRLSAIKESLKKRLRRHCPDCGGGKWAQANRCRQCNLRHRKAESARPAALAVA